MTELFSEKELSASCGALIKTTLVDYPGRVATALFLCSCNLRCPYCYNKDLVVNFKSEEVKSTLNTLQEVVSHLEKRKNLISGFTISGGEPLLSPLAPRLIKFAKSLGYKIKLDTNGTLPHLLEPLIADKETRPDFIAMDFKTSPQNYGKLLPSASTGKTPGEKAIIADFSEILQKSIDLIKSNYSMENCEWRTVLVPTLVDENDIEKMASMLPENASWQFANFQNKNCLSSDFNNISPYLDSEIENLIKKAASKVKGAALR